MKIERVKIMNMDEAIRAMRNPMNSWDQSDSKWVDPTEIEWKESAKFVVGTKDNELAKKLIRAGGDHRKFMRQIFVSTFITLPRYIWTELDTYKVATVRNSCSTMHKLGSQALSTNDFQDGIVMIETLDRINTLAESYRAVKDVDILRKMKQLLPEGFLQAATYTCNYENLYNIYHSRKKHRMEEWSKEDGICEWIESLPMMSEWLHCKK